MGKADAASLEEGLGHAQFPHVALPKASLRLLRLFEEGPSTFNSNSGQISISSSTCWLRFLILNLVI
jgi:hypothetical protein